jgi:hypothetical protein
VSAAKSKGSWRGSTRRRPSSAYLWAMSEASAASRTGRTDSQPPGRSVTSSRPAVSSSAKRRRPVEAAPRRPTVASNARGAPVRQARSTQAAYSCQACGCARRSSGTGRKVYSPAGFGAPRFFSPAHPVFSLFACRSGTVTLGSAASRASDRDATNKGRAFKGGGCHLMTIQSIYRNPTRAGRGYHSGPLCTMAGRVSWPTFRRSSATRQPGFYA